MDTLFTVMLIGAFLELVGWIWSIIVAARVHAGWVVGMLLVSVITVPWFAVTHWDKAKRPFSVWGVGFVMMLCSLLYAVMVHGK